MHACEQGCKCSDCCFAPVYRVTSLGSCNSQRLHRGARNAWSQRSCTAEVDGIFTAPGPSCTASSVLP
eukprot:924589-Alexandrium_andersonii.AAC.1